MRHLIKYALFEDNIKQNSFLVTGAAAGAQGKELRKPGQAPILMSDTEYQRHMDNAFDDQKLRYRRVKKLKKKPKQRLFKPLQRK